MVHRGRTMELACYFKIAVKEAEEEARKPPCIIRANTFDFLSTDCSRIKERESMPSTATKRADVKLSYR